MKSQLFVLKILLATPFQKRLFHILWHQFLQPYSWEKDRKRWIDLVKMCWNPAEMGGIGAAEWDQKGGGCQANWNIIVKSKSIICSQVRVKTEIVVYPKGNRCYLSLYEHQVKTKRSHIAAAIRAVGQWYEYTTLCQKMQFWTETRHGHELGYRASWTWHAQKTAHVHLMMQLKFETWLVGDICWSMLALVLERNHWSSCQILKES